MNKVVLNVFVCLALTVLTVTGLLSCKDANPTPDRPLIIVTDKLDTINNIQTIIDDITKPHEAKPHGVPDSYGWNSMPRAGAGPGTFTAFTSWGQVYEDIIGNKSTNSRVQLKNMETWYLSKRDNKWHNIQTVTSKLAGAAYREDFAADAHIPGDIKVNSQGVLSVTCGNGYNLHFWPQAGRASIDPNDIANIFVSCQARLILADVNKPDDRATCRYILSIGGDWWLDLTAGWDNFKTNYDAFLGRFKYVKKEWRAFNAIQITTGLDVNPPPIRPFDRE